MAKIGHHTTLNLDEKAYQAWKKLGIPASYIFNKGLESCIGAEDLENDMRAQIFKLERALIRVQEELLRQQIKDRVSGETKNEV